MVSLWYVFPTHRHVGFQEKVREMVSIMAVTGIFLLIYIARKPKRGKHLCPNCSTPWQYLRDDPRGGKWYMCYKCSPPRYMWSDEPL